VCVLNLLILYNVAQSYKTCRYLTEYHHIRRMEGWREL
jgi:hypothetical protein